MIVLAYLGPLAAVPLLLDKGDAEVQWHARNGIVLMLAELALLFAYLALSILLTFARFGLGLVMILLLVCGWIGVLALHILAIIKGINGDRLVVPGVSDYASRF
jgi:uncharacterized membrane protein